MKPLILLILLVPGASASVGTFTGELEKQGPEAEYRLGIAAEEELQVEIEVPEIEGLEIETENLVFDPEEASRSFQVNGSSFPAEVFHVNVSSGDVDQQVYEVPVTFRAFRDSGSTQVIHEREYLLEYETDLSPGYTGPLIPEDPERDEPENVSEEEEEENGLTVDEGEETVEEDGVDTVTWFLAAALVLVLLYIARSIM